jgi:uncharacterized repeat protein (TIGR01451 family)
MTGTPVKYSLGNLVWLDNGVGSNTNNGRVDLGEASAGAGVTVVLVSNAGAVMTTTTDGNGYYRFDNLDAGSYNVLLPASNFIAGGVLSGYISSIGQQNNFAATDNAFDHGSDSLDPRIDGVRSSVVMLGLVNPTGDKDVGATGAGDNGPTGDMFDNLTADFGFWKPTPGIDVSFDVRTPFGLSKAEALKDGREQDDVESLKSARMQNLLVTHSGASSIDALAFAKEEAPTLSTIVTWTYYITNTGNITLTNIVLVDIPAGPVTNCTPSLNGLLLGVGGTVMCTRTSTAAANGQYTNTAVVTGSATITGVVLSSIPPIVVDTYLRSYELNLRFDLGNRVWLDLNNNGVVDVGEPAPSKPVTITLRDVNGTTFTTTTDVTGYYTFTNVPAGNYVATVLAINFAPNGALANMISSEGVTNSVAAGSNNRDHGVDVPDPALAGVSSASVQIGISDPLNEDVGVNSTPNGDSGNNLTIDFGFVPLLRVGDYVWEDVNHNGQQDTSEPPIAGVLVTLTRPDTSQITTSTSVTGYYAFNGLFPNLVYTVTFSTPVGYEPTFANLGGDSADSDGLVVPVTLIANNFTTDSGFWRPASLGDTVWLDSNNNGLREAGEPGIANVSVRLFSGGVVISTTQTNASGNYLFTNLISGIYTVSFGLPGGYVFTSANIGGDETLDSDANVANGVTDPIVITSGMSEMRVDAGLYVLPQLGIEKRVTTTNGGGNGATVRPGDELRYTLIARNSGNTIATNVVVTDPLESDAVDYIVGSASPEPTRIVGNNLVWVIGTLNPNEQKEITFKVKIANNLSASTVIRNTAQINGREGGTIVTTRNSNTVDNPFEPSVVTIASFTASSMGGRGVRLRWVTISEIDTWSFTLYRAEGNHSGDQIPDSAQKITPDAILSEGRGGGGSTYLFDDIEADVSSGSGKTYTYWLVETETTGEAIVYGPAKWSRNAATGQASKLYLPLLVRSVRSNR